MPSHNSKYYTKSLKTNTVKSHNIATLFKRKINEPSDGEPSSKLSTNIDQNQDTAESISDNDSGSIHVSTPEVTNAEITDDDSISLKYQSNRRYSDSNHWTFGQSRFI